jgi:opacity protein-like surface antigen
MRHLLLTGAVILTFGLFAATALADEVNINVQADGETRVDIDEEGEDVAGQPMLFVNGGGSNTLRDLDEARQADFDTGYNVGGGIGIQLTPGVALRGVYTYSRAQGEDSLGVPFLSPVAGAHFNRHYYGADLQFRAMNDSGFTPYIFAGGGAVTVDPDDSSVLLSPDGSTSFTTESFTKPAGRFGLGFEYQVPNTGFGLYAEGSGWVYNWDRYGFDRTQVDTNWGGGLSYRFGY